MILAINLNAMADNTIFIGILIIGTINKKDISFNLQIF
jgi:hypothetical protein